MSDDLELKVEVSAVEEKIVAKSVWANAWPIFKNDKIAIIAIVIFGIYALTALLSLTGVIATGWDIAVGESYAAPSLQNLFGTDVFGRSVFLKIIKGVEIAMSVGFVTTLISITIGVFFGSIAGFFGGIVDEIVVWLYTTVSSIPSIMLLMAIAFISGKGFFAIVLAMGITSWVPLCRLVRSEVIRHKEREYVLAAVALGVPSFDRLFRHIIPNIFHVVIINFTLTFQFIIKSEVILSYLGIGIQGTPSWGIMIDEARLELARGIWWQLGCATIAIMIIVFALNILGDSLRDALDPKLKNEREY